MKNDNNKNREYPEIDKRIKDTFIKYSTAQKTKVYDMYARFYRWAFDRLDNNGVIAFVTNRSFIDSRTFDGFRKCVQDEFDYAYIIDTQSDVRANPKISGTGHNVFGIQTGVAIMFFVKKLKRDNTKCKIQYVTLDDFWRKEQKLQWFTENPFKQIGFENVKPDKNNNWINIADNDFETLLPIADKAVKQGKSKKALFELFSTGISTNRDEWIIDLSEKVLKQKMKFFAEHYNKTKSVLDTTIKWSRNLKQRFDKGKKEEFDSSKVIKFKYRPYLPAFIYHSEVFIDEHGLTNQIFNDKNIAISISGNGSSKAFQALGVDTFLSLDFLEKTQCLPLYRYDENGNRIENITDWGLNQFAKQYGSRKIKKEDIFHYVYAVLHNPAYRKKYELNLKREFPRIPFYKDFFKWAKWGKQLIEVHIGYEKAKPYALEQIDTVYELEDANAYALYEKAKLKADKSAGTIVIDGFTLLKGIPATAWEYKLGNRSALEWVLDQYKESKPKDPTVAERFNTYRFADYKEEVIALLKKICTVSVETMEVIAEMEKEKE